MTCPISTGEEALESLGLETISLGLQIGLLAAFIVFCRTLQYLLLHFVDQRPRK